MSEVSSKRYIEFTNASGKRCRYAVDVNQRIGTVRADDTKETDICYIEESFAVQSNRASGSGEVFIQYENGLLSRIQTNREDGTEEAEISFRDGRLNSVQTNRDDESCEAIIAYNQGQLQLVSSVRKNSSVETAMTFADGRLKHVEVPYSLKLDMH